MKTIIAVAVVAVAVAVVGLYANATADQSHFSSNTVNRHCYTTPEFCI